MYVYRKICAAIQLDQNQNGARTQGVYDLLHSSEFEVSDAHFVNDETVEVHYKSVGEFAEQNDKVNVVIAAFTTAYARLKLYDLLDLLQERVLYLRYGFRDIRA